MTTDSILRKGECDLTLVTSHPFSGPRMSVARGSLVPISPNRLESAMRFAGKLRPKLASELSANGIKFPKQAISLVLKGRRKRVRIGVRSAIATLTIGEENAEWLGGGPASLTIQVPGLEPLWVLHKVGVAAGSSEEDPLQMLSIRNEEIALDRTIDDLDLDRLKLLREILPIIPRVDNVRQGLDTPEGYADSLRVTMAVRIIWTLSSTSKWHTFFPPPRGEGDSETWEVTQRDDDFRYGIATLEATRRLLSPWIRTSTPIPLKLLDALRRQSSAMWPREDDMLFPDDEVGT